MKKALVKPNLKRPHSTYKPAEKLAASKKKSLKTPFRMMIGALLVGIVLFLSALVLMNINKSQEDRSQAKEPETGCKWGTQVNGKGNVVCADKPKQNEINGQTGCKNGKIEYRDVDGSPICLDKCKSGYSIGVNPETGHLGCVKPDSARGLDCAGNTVPTRNQKGNWFCASCPKGQVKSGNSCVTPQPTLRPDRR